jgi:spore coat protein U-like protein
MDNGAGGGTGPTDRRLAFGSTRITYGIYRDAAFALPWGTSSGSNTASVNAVSGNTSLTVYGRVPAQTTPVPGTYLDTVIVTATY